MVSKCVAIGEALQTRRAQEATNAVVVGLQMSPQCEARTIHFLAVGIGAVQFFHLDGLNVLAVIAFTLALSTDLTKSRFWDD